MMWVCFFLLLLFLLVFVLLGCFFVGCLVFCFCVCVFLLINTSVFNLVLELKAGGQIFHIDPAKEKLNHFSK